MSRRFSAVVLFFLVVAVPAFATTVFKFRRAALLLLPIAGFACLMFLL